MNKNFKFRVWDNWTPGFMLEQKPFVFIQPDGFRPESTSDILNDPDRFVVQKCLYLKDNKGVKLYEGDVLKHKDNSARSYRVEWSGEDCAYIMKSSDGGAAFLSQDYLLNFEIIGTVLQGNYVKI